MIEYVFNASIFTIIEIFSFLTNYEFESRMSFDSSLSEENIVRERIQRIREREIVSIMKKNLNIRQETHEKKSAQSDHLR